MQTRHLQALTLVVLLCLAWPALASEGGGGSASEKDIFNADIGNFVFTLIIFGAVVLILGKFAWKPILNVLHEREQTIRTSLETAKREREQAAKLLADYETQLTKAREQAMLLTGRKVA